MAPPTSRAKGGSPESQVLYLNNMGCAHFRVGKHHAAAFYYLRALRENHALQVTIARL
eukprot:COSAG01_NODE_1001_length_12210_cov_60.505491_10_plen_58_part_00